MSQENSNDPNSPEKLRAANAAFTERSIDDQNKPNPAKLLAAVPEYVGQRGAMIVPAEFVERLKGRVFIGADRPERDSSLDVN